jgi:hypothetical protein
MRGRRSWASDSEWDSVCWTRVVNAYVALININDCVVLICIPGRGIVESPHRVWRRQHFGSGLILSSLSGVDDHLKRS